MGKKSLNFTIKIIAIFFLSHLIFNNLLLAQSDSSISLSQIEQELDQAEKLYKTKNYTQALSKFNLVLAKDSYNINALTYKALCYYNLKEYSRASSIFDYLLKENRLDNNYSFQAGYSFLQDKQYDKAFSQFRKVSSKNRHYDVAMFYAAACLEVLNKEELAMSYLKKAVILPVKQAKAKKEMLERLNKAISQKSKPNNDQLKTKPSTTNPPNSQKKQTKVITYNPSQLTSSSLAKRTMKMRNQASHFSLEAYHFNINPIYEPVKAKNPHAFSSTFLTGVASFDLASIYDQTNNYQFAIDLYGGPGYTMEYISQSYIINSLLFDSYAVNSINSLESTRHDNLIWQLGTSPWMEWLWNNVWKFYVSGYATLNYANFTKDQFIYNFGGDVSLSLLWTELFMTKLYSKVNYWMNLSPQSGSDQGRFGQYSLGVDLIYQPISVVQIKLLAKSMFDERIKKSVAKYTHAIELGLSYLPIINFLAKSQISLDLSAAMEYLEKYQVQTMSQENQKLLLGGYQAGFNLGISFKIINDLIAKTYYQQRYITWSNSLSEDDQAIVDDNAPNYYDAFLFTLNWDLFLKKDSF